MIVKILFSVVIVAIFRLVLSEIQETTGQNGTFLSVNYPELYSPSLDVTYLHRFDTPGPQQIYVEYKYVLEDPDPGGVCVDYINVTLDTEPQCGAAVGFYYLQIPDNMFSLTFHTNAVIQRRGFSYTFSVISGQCQPTLNNAGDYKYQLMPLVGMPSKNSLVVSARGCRVVDIAFSSSWFNVYDGCREFILGGWSNTKSQIRTCATGVETGCVAEKEITHSPLNCCEFRDFWFTWTSMSLRAGKGKAVGANSFVLHTFSQPIDISYIHIAGYNNNPYVIKFHENFPASYCNTTPNLTPPSTCPVPTTTDAAEVTTQPDSTTTSASQTTTDKITTIKITTEMAVTTSQVVVTTAPTDVSETTNIDRASTVEANGPSAPETTSRTSAARTTTYSREQCWCNCVKREAEPTLSVKEQKDKQNKLEQIKEEVAQTIKVNLTISAKNVSANINRYISAPDPRESSKVIGITGGIFCAIPITLIAMLDVFDAAVAIKRKIQNFLQKYHGRKDKELEQNRVDSQDSE